MIVDGRLDCELERRHLKEAIKLASKEWKQKKDCRRRATVARAACGKREYRLGHLNSQQSHHYSTSCNMLLSELRSCVGQSDWHSVARLIMFSLNMTGALMPVIWRASLLVLLYHENASHQRLNDLLEQCLGLRSVFEKRSFLKNIFSVDGKVLKKMTKQGTQADFGVGHYCDSKLELTKF